MIKSFLLLGFLCVAAVPAAASSDVSADHIAVTDLTDGHYSFSQGAWSSGGIATGTFAGIDTNDDGQLSAAAGEITGFSFAFSGNASVDPFVLGFDDLLSLVYDLDGGPLGNGVDLNGFEGISAVGLNIRYTAGPMLLGVCGSVSNCAQVSEVPEASTWAMMVAGFGLTGARLRRRQSYRLA